MGSPRRGNATIIGEVNAGHRAGAARIDFPIREGLDVGQGYYDEMFSEWLRSPTGEMHVLSRLLALHIGIPLSASRQGLRLQDRRRLLQLGLERRRRKMPQVPQASSELPGMSRSFREDLRHLRRDRPDVPSRRQALEVADRITNERRANR